MSALEVASELIILAVLSFCGSVVVAYAIWRANRRQVQQQKNLLDRQVWIDSARLILELLEKYENSDLGVAHDVVYNHESFEKPQDRTQLRLRYLNYLTSITALYYDGVLVEGHVIGYFGGALNDLGAHKETVEYLWDRKQQSYYWPLRQWLKEKTGHQFPDY